MNEISQTAPFAPHRGTIPSEIQTLKWVSLSDAMETMQPLCLKNAEIIWIKKGSGRLVIDSNRYDLRDNTIYCLAPGQMRRFYPDSRLEGHYISFAPAQLLQEENQPSPFGWLRTIGDPFQLAMIIPDRPSEQEMEEIIKKMKTETDGYFLLRTEVLKGLLKLFVIYLFRSARIETHKISQFREGDLVAKFLGLLKKYYKSKKMVAEYAGELNVTPNYLNRTVKKISGYTASHHIQQQIITEAKRQAVSMGTSMKEVAYFLGFDNTSHFSRFFKNNSGTNFSSFKKEIDLYA